MRNTPACFINSTMSPSNRRRAAKSRRRALTSDRSRCSASLRPSIVVCSAIGIASGRQTAFRRDVTINIKPGGKLFSAARVAFSQRYFLQRESSLAEACECEAHPVLCGAMHPYIHAKTHPDKPAYIMAGSGETVTYRQLDEQSNRIAQLFRSLGLKAGRPRRAVPREQPALLRDLLGRPALGPDLHRDQLAADRGRGRVHRRATAARSCSSPRRISPTRRPSCAPLMPGVPHRYMIDGTIAGYESWEEAVAAQPATPIADETAGHDMLYSSGTTGRPKGVLPVRRAAADRRRQPAAADHAQALRHGRDTRSISRRRRSITRLRCAST